MNDVISYGEGNARESYKMEVRSGETFSNGKNDKIKDNGIYCIYKFSET